VRLDSALSILLSAMMVLPAPMLAQQAAAAPTVELKITVVEGAGATNSITTDTATRIVVEVRDAAGKPVPGAEVVFSLPASGPGGAFTDWMLSQTVKTDAQGRAATFGFTPNDQEGSFKVGITATFGNSKANAEVSQSNVLDKNHPQALDSRKGWWKWAVGIGGVAVLIGIVAATR
jgi:hypothetical protein